MPPSLTRWSLLVAAAAVVACDQDTDRAPPSPPNADVLSVGRPVAPRRVRVPAPGAIELRASSPRPSGRPRWFAALSDPPRDRPRDVCVVVGIVAEGLPEADTSCDVSVNDSATSLVYDFTRRALATDSGKELYLRRQGTVEPVFGQIKTNRAANRFLRRGRSAVRSEWRLLAATHNLLKLHQHRLAPT